jgi:hypothetical protein
MIFLPQKNNILFGLNSSNISPSNANKQDKKIDMESISTNTMKHKKQRQDEAIDRYCSVVYKNLDLERVMKKVENRSIAIFYKDNTEEKEGMVEHLKFREKKRTINDTIKAQFHFYCDGDVDRFIESISQICDSLLKNTNISKNGAILFKNFFQMQPDPYYIDKANNQKAMNDIENELKQIDREYLQSQSQNR